MRGRTPIAAATVRLPWVTGAQMSEPDAMSTDLRVRLRRSTLTSGL